MERLACLQGFFQSVLRNAIRQTCICQRQALQILHAPVVSGNAPPLRCCLGTQPRRRVQSVRALRFCKRAGGCAGTSAVAAVFDMLYWLPVWLAKHMQIEVSLYDRLRFFLRLREGCDGLRGLGFALCGAGAANIACAVSAVGAGSIGGALEAVSYPHVG